MKQGSDDWYKSRVGLITSSRVAPILGISPFGDRYSTMRAMVRDFHGAESEFVDNPAVLHGNSYESTARMQFEMDYEIDVTDGGFHVHSNGWAGTSPDGFTSDGGVIEIKCPWKGIKKNISEMPHYYAQCQWHMYVTGTKKCHFYQWEPKNSTCEIVKFDQAWIDTAESELRAFYDEYLAAIKEPAEYLEPKRIEINTNRSKMLIDEIDNMREAKDRAEERIAEIMTELQESCGGKDALIWGRKLTKVEKAGAISYAKAVKALAPKADLEPYRGAGSHYWKLT